MIHGNPNAASDLNLKFNVILNPSRESKMMKEEIFGPILPVLTFISIDEAINYITEEQPKPLVIHFFGATNCANQHRVEAETSSGTFVVNDTIYQILNPYLPFGGIGQSGQGRYHGFEGFKSFSNMKSALIKYQLDFFPYNQIFPPYTEAKQRVTLALMNVGKMSQHAMMLWSLLFVVVCVLVPTLASVLGERASEPK